MASEGQNRTASCSQTPQFDFATAVTSNLLFKALGRNLMAQCVRLFTPIVLERKKKHFSSRGLSFLGEKLKFVFIWRITLLLFLCFSVRHPALIVIISLVVPNCRLVLRVSCTNKTPPSFLQRSRIAAVQLGQTISVAATARVVAQFRRRHDSHASTVIHHFTKGPSKRLDYIPTTEKCN